MTERTCIVCGHQACPHCGDWCDIITDYDTGELCCDGECTYVPEVALVRLESADSLLEYLLKSIGSQP